MLFRFVLFENLINEKWGDSDDGTWQSEYTTEGEG